MKVYRDYDQAALDAQYNLRARFPDHPLFFERWLVRGNSERVNPSWHLDLSFGLTPAQRLDLIAPPQASAARAPLFVFFHGGYWQAQDKNGGTFLARAFVESGIAFATIDYTLAPTAGLDQIVREARDALAWLWRNAPSLGCDGDRIFVSGHSAGGHLATMLAATDWSRYGGLPADLVKGVVSVSGIYDLEPLRLSFHNRVLNLDAAAARRNSPLHLEPRTMRVVLTVGSRETEEFLRQQAEFAAAWRDRGVQVDVVSANGLHHFDILEKLGDPSHPIGAAAIALIRGAK